MSSYHPNNDPRLKERHSWYSDNPANDALYLSRLIDKMEQDPQIREIVHEKFYQGDLSWLWHDGQHKIARMIATHPDEVEFLILCSRQLGKSFFILTYVIEHLSKPYPGRKPLARVFCQTQKQIDEIINDNMQLLQAIAPPGFIKRTKSEKRYEIGYGELRLGMVSFAHVHGKRGGNATLIVTEESGFSPSEAFKNAINNVLSPQLLRSGGKMIHVTTSSDDSNHYVHKVIQPKCDAKGTLINLTIYDNAQLTDQQIIKAYERVDDGTDEGWRREYLCQVVRSSLLTVIPEFHDNIIKEATRPDFYNLLTSIDYGGVQDKHGIILGWYDFKRDKIVIEDERLLSINTPTDVIIENALELDDDEEARRVCDAPGQVRVDMTQAGFSFFFPKKDEFSAGINELRIAIKTGLIEIDPKCKNLISQLKYGRLNKQRKDFERTKEHSHLDLVAALIYLLRHIDKDNPYPHWYRFKEQGISPDDAVRRPTANKQENFLLSHLK